MNKHLFRVIFNKRRGLRMAVQETASSDGKGRHADSGAPGRGFALKPLAAALVLALAWPGAAGQIMPERAAPGHQRPTVLNSANGTPTVNIQTPSAAGVSRNRYQQFDMNGRGAILNNSRTDVQSRIGGWVRGNASLARGSARVIVNEINSSAASRLAGTLEVAGQRADVIVANPAGLVVDGLSFINAAGVTLTTGKPLYGAGGGLDGFSVQSGLIHAQGQGLDATAADYAHILARAVSLNAGVWAQDLRVVTGANEVAADGQLRAVQAAGADKPQFALDVAQLGGMYGGRIFMVGTEAGLGVRNAGVLSVTSAGLSLSVDGRLENAGAMASNAAAADLRIAAQGIDNSGTLTSQQDLLLDDARIGTANSGTLQARRELLARTGPLDNQAAGLISAQRLDIEAARLANAGHIGQTGTQALDIASATLSNTGADAVLGARSAPEPAPVAALGPAAVLAPGASESAESAAGAGAGLPPPTSVRDGSVIHAMPAEALVLAPGRIAVAQHLDNRGTLLANGATDLRVAQALTNSGTLQVRQLQTDGMLDNSQGSLRAQQLSGTHDALVNRAGEIQLGSDLHLQARRIDNSGGSIVSARALTVHVAQTLDNDGGTLLAGSDIALQARELQSNAQARIVSNPGSVRLKVEGALGNRQGAITTASHDVHARIDIQAGSLDSRQGRVSQNSAGLLRIAVGDALRSDQAQVVGNGSVEVTAGSLSNQGGSISAQAQLTLSTRAGLDNADGALVASRGRLQLQAGGALENRGGSISAGAGLQATAADIDNTRGRMAAQAELQLRSAAGLSNDQGALQALGAVDLHAGQRLDNQSGVVASSEGSLTLQAQAIDNRRGQIVSALEATLDAQQLDNRAGEIAQRSIGQLRIEASENLDNAQGRIVSHGQLVLHAGETSNRGGEIISQDQAQLQLASLQSAQGLIQAGGALHLQSRSDIDNHQGRMRAHGPADVEAGGQFINAEGRLESGAAVSVASAALDNRAGTISSTAALQVHTGMLGNAHGTLLANETLQLRSTELDNSAGAIGGASIAIDTADGRVSNDKGRIIAAKGDLDLQVGALHNRQGLLQAAKDLEVDTHGQALANTGTMRALGNARVNAAEVDNTSGVIHAAQSLQLNGSALNNRAGEIGAATVAVDTRKGALGNVEGKIVASAGELKLQTGALDNAQGLLQAATLLEVHTHGQPLTNTGTMQALGNAAIDAAEVDNSGTIQAAMMLQLNATKVSNTAGEISAAALAIDTWLGPVTNAGGKIIASEGDLHLQTGALNNAEGLLQSAQDLDIRTHGQPLTNTGTLLAMGHGRLDVGEMNNTGGIVQAGSDASAGKSTLTINAAGPMTNAEGVLLARQTLTLSTTALNNHAGKIGAAALAIDTHGGPVSNDEGTIIASERDLDLQSGALRNGTGRLQAARNVTVDTHGQPLANTGTLVASGNATVNAASVTNSGTMQAVQTLQLHSTALTNSGEISAASVAIETQKGALHNDAGKIIASAGDLKLQTGALSNTQGVLQAAKDLQVHTHGQPLANTGTLVASGNATVNAAAVTNSGTMQAAQTLQLDSAALANSGEISAASVAIKTQKGALHNDAGKIIASAGDLKLQTGALNNAQGLLQAASNVEVHTHGQPLANTGTLLASGNATVNAAAVTNSGTMQAAQTLQLDSTALANSGEISAASVAIKTQKGALHNDAGRIIASAGDLRLQSGTLNNAQGLLQAAKNLDIATHGQPLTNTGSLLALGNAAIDAGEVSNRGTIQAAQMLQLNATQLVNNAGEISGASVAIDTWIGSVSNAGGRIIASDGDLNLQTGALHNGPGLLQAGKDLNIETHGQVLTNEGTLRALGNASVHAAGIDNTRGVIHAAQVLQLKGSALDNGTGQIGAAAIAIDTQSGALNNHSGKIIASAGALRVKSGALHNDKGLLRSEKELHIDTQGQKLSNAGTLQAPADIHIHAGDVDNSGGSILAGSDTEDSAHLTLTAHGTVSNTAGHMLASGNAQLTAARLDNSQGEIGAGSRLDARIGGAVDNAHGQLLGNAALILHSESLRNSHGVLSSGAGPVDIMTGAFDNVRGTLTATGAARITSGALDNSEGKIGAASVDVDTQGQPFKNLAAELLAGAGDLHVRSGYLDNQRGRIASAQNAELTAQGIDNAAGRITAAELNIRSQDATAQWVAIANPAGSILADQRLEINSAALNNTAGTIQTTAAGSALILDSHGADITNQQSGEAAGIVSAGSLHITAQQGSVNNANAGVIGASGDMRLEAQRIANQRGAITAGGKLHVNSTADHGVGIDNSDAGSMQSIGDMQILASAGAILSHRGTILSNGDVQVHSRGLVNNTEGRIKAGNRLSVIDAHVAAGAPLASATQTVNNQGGTLFAGKQLTLRSRSLSGAGQMQSQGGMQFDLPGDYSHHGDLHADGQANIAIAGGFSNLGGIWGGSELLVSADRIENQGGASMKSGWKTSVVVGRWLVNRGLINGLDTRVDADVLDNVGTGRIYGNHLSIAANRLHNRAENGKAATIASRYDLDVGVPVVQNENGAEIAGGDMRFGARLDDQRRATGKAIAISNVYATIDAKGSIDFAADVVNNKNAGVDVQAQVYQGSQASGNLVKVEGRGVESAASYRWIEKNEKIPFYNYGHSLEDLGEIPQGWPGRGYIKMADPGNFGKTLPLAYEAVEVPNNHDEIKKYTYRYEPNDSPRFHEYGVEKPHDYNVVAPIPQIFGAADVEGVLYWPRGSNQAGYAEKIAIYENSIAAAKKLNNAILHKIKEFNRVEGHWVNFRLIEDVRTEVYADQVASSKPAHIYAGGNIIISGLLNNEDSTVIARGVIVAGNQHNPSRKGVETTKTTGKAIDHTLDSKRSLKKGGRKKYKYHTSDPAPYEDSSTREVELSTGVIQQHYSGDHSPAQVVQGTHSGNQGSGSASPVMHVVRRIGSAPPATVQPALASPDAVQSAESIGVNEDAAGPAFSAWQGGIELGAMAAPGGVNASPSIAGERVVAASSIQPALADEALTQLLPAPAASASAPLAVHPHAGTNATATAMHAASGFSVTSVQPSRAADGVWTNPFADITVVAAGSIAAPVAFDGTVHAAVSAAPSGVPAPALVPAAGQEMEIRTSALPQYLPRSSRYVVNAHSSNKPLIETDPEFTHHASWLSSDHMLDALRLDPALLQKRLGDGYYEQQLVRDQVALLTGRRFLGAYSDDEAQYQALLQNGITFAQDHQLRPGIALSAQQMAQLTSDLVWLVAEEVTLSDGSVQTVLVPKVYVVAKPGDLSITGALISGDVVISQSKDDFHNSGTIAGRRAVVIEARDIDNIGGRITGGAVALEAERNINVVGGTVSAALSLMAKAGNDINVITTTSSNRGGNADNGYSNTVIDRVAGLILEPGDVEDGSSPVPRSLVVQAGRNAKFQAALISNMVKDAETEIKAGNNIDLSTVDTSQEQRIRWDAKNHLSFGQSQEVGTQVNTLGRTKFEAGGEFEARAAQVQTTKALEIKAVKDVKIAAGTETQTLDSASFTKRKGLFSSSTNTSAHSSHKTQALGSMLGGDTVVINTEGSIVIEGSQVISDNGTSFDAGNDVLILEAEQTESWQSMHKSTRRGLSVGSGGGIGFSLGSQRQSADQDVTRRTAAASTVASLNGKVQIKAGNQYRQVGSDVLALNGHLGVTAKNIEVIEARESEESATHTASKQSGLSASISTPLLSVMQTASSLAETAGKTDDTRMQALAAGVAALNIYNHREDLAALAKGDVKTAASISATLGSSQSRSDSTQLSSTGRGSRMLAQSIELNATGAGENSGILVQGSDITGGTDTSLIADGDIKLLASENSRSDRSSNSSSSAALGVAANIGQGGMSLGITASASKGRGHTNSDDVTYSASHVSAGSTLTIKSGRDTELIGATASGKRVIADVGGDLTIESLQDISQHAAKQQSLGGSITMGAGFSASGSYSNSRAHGNFASVNEQSGIQAGDDGFIVRVAGHTHLEGGEIASTQQAIDNNLKNGTRPHHVDGDLREYVVDSYFLRNGFRRLEGKCGNGNCFDGVYVKNGKVIINEVKPIGAKGSVKLGVENKGTNLPVQTTDLWVEHAIARLEKSGNAELIETSKIIRGAQNDGNLIKTVSGVDRHGINFVRVP